MNDHPAEPKVVLHCDPATPEERLARACAEYALSQFQGSGMPAIAVEVAVGFDGKRPVRWTALPQERGGA